MEEIGSNIKYNDYLKKEVLCKTIAGNDVYLLTITDFKKDYHSIEKREVIVLSARVHPGENVSSYVMEGVIGFLLSYNEKA